MTDVAGGLARVREELVGAIVADHARRGRRRRARLAGVAVAATLAVVGGSVAATTGLFSPAPEGVIDEFGELNTGGGAVVDASRAVLIGTVGDVTAYAAPAVSGGFCVYFERASAQGASGFEGSCKPIEGTEGNVPAETVALTTWLSEDGGFAFGRVGAEDAVTVEITLPGHEAVVTTPVGPEGFFLARVPAGATQALTAGETATAIAKDAQGNTVAGAVTDSEPAAQTDPSH